MIDHVIKSETLLHHACDSNGNIETVEFLLRKNANVNYQGAYGTPMSRVW